MKLTIKSLRKLVKEEMMKCDPVEDHKDDAEETDADEYADSLEKQIDFVKALKIEENRLRARLNKIAEQRKNLLKKKVR